VVRIGVDCKCIVVGDGPLGSQLWDLALKLNGLAVEGMPLTVPEAMASYLATHTNERAEVSKMEIAGVQETFDIEDM